MARSTSNPPKFVQPTIDGRERLHPPKRDPADHRSRVSYVEREAILVRSLRGLSAPRIGRELDIGATTVRNAVHDIHYCPSLLLLMRVFELAKADGQSWWRCLICGTTGRGSRSSAFQHVLNEVFPLYPDWFRDPRELSHDIANTYLAIARRLPRQMREGSTTMNPDQAYSLLARYNMPLPSPKRFGF